MGVTILPPGVKSCVRAKITHIGTNYLPAALGVVTVPLGCFQAPRPAPQCAQRKTIDKDGVQRTETYCPLPPPVPKTTLCVDASPNCKPELCGSGDYGKVAKIMCGKTCGVC
ncbi:hypothetical protein AAVH_01295 [Aphelenchoides avenae]|nr:hypothetical protein AAVH_01295 [Aphelenchus avenae]